MTNPTDNQFAGDAPDGIRVVRWFALFAMWLAAGFVALLILLPQSEPLNFSGWRAFQESVQGLGPWLKGVIFALYLTFCSFFFPLNSGWIISAVCVAPGLTGQMWSTILIVTFVGAAASTMANLNDYHLIVLLMRSRRVAKIRHTRTYQTAMRWFDRSPFFLLVLFNFLPVPIDVVRVLAASHRYPRGLYTAANFLGRLIRYAVIASVTWMLGSGGWMVAVALLAISTVSLLGRFLYGQLRKKRSEA